MSSERPNQHVEHLQSRLLSSPLRITKNSTECISSLKFSLASLYNRSLSSQFFLIVHQVHQDYITKIYRDWTNHEEDLDYRIERRDEQNLRIHTAQCN